MNNIHGLNGGGGAAPRGGGGASGSPGLMEQIKGGWRSLPFFNKFMIAICSFLYLLSWITPIVNYYFVLVPYLVTKF